MFIFNSFKINHRLVLVFIVKIVNFNTDDLVTVFGNKAIVATVAKAVPRYSGVFVSPKFIGEAGCGCAVVKGLDVETIVTKNFFEACDQLQTNHQGASRLAVDCRFLSLLIGHSRQFVRECIVL